MVQTYGERVARARAEMGLTQEQFAEGAGIKLRTLQDIENGKVARPQKRNSDKIDAFLGLRREGEAEAEWTPDVQAASDLVGAYLSALPPEQQAAERRALIRWLATRPHP